MAARQIALPLSGAAQGERLVVGAGNEAVLQSCAAAREWPFGTALLWGAPRSGKSLIARWFEAEGHGLAIDDAEKMEEAALFHRWNRAQESRTPLLIVGRPLAADGWRVLLPDLASRLGAAMTLTIQAPDDAMLAGLLAAHARLRGLALGEDAAAYLLPRCERSYAGIERLIAAIDRLSLERKVPPTLAIWREALTGGAPRQGDLL